MKALLYSLLSFLALSLGGFAATTIDSGSLILADLEIDPEPAPVEWSDLVLEWEVIHHEDIAGGIFQYVYSLSDGPEEIDLFQAVACEPLVGGEGSPSYSAGYSNGGFSFGPIPGEEDGITITPIGTAPSLELSFYNFVAPFPGVVLIGSEGPDIRASIPTPNACVIPEPSSLLLLTGAGLPLLLRRRRAS
jgi:hypothetical protein